MISLEFLDLNFTCPWNQLSYNLLYNEKNEESLPPQSDLFIRNIKYFHLSALFINIKKIETNFIMSMKLII